MRRRAQIDQAAVDYEAARLREELAEAISWYMHNKKPTAVTRSELARRLGVTPGRVSQILSGDENITLNTLAVPYVWR